MRQGRVTIYDVARHCGVAASTVSRTFADPARVNVATRERVRAAAREVGYEPRPLARVESPGRSRTLMLVVTDIANPYYAPLIKAAQARAIERNFTLALTDSDESPEVEARNLRQLLAAASGGILATSRLSDDAVRQLAQHRALVMVNRDIDGLPSLFVDTAAGMRKAVRHLAALGHRRIAYLSGPRSSWVNSQRWRAAQEEASSLGIRAGFLGPFAPNQQGGHEAADALILDGATAAIAYNDLIALGTLQRLHVAGIRLPDEISLIGCDDIFGADLAVPALTTIAGPTATLGRCAVDTVCEELSGRDGPQAVQRFDAHLVVRGSTGPAPVTTGGN
ncbi:LacI family DNA-binding transcriptional regulator [Amycolatopsis endophytica]|uniref:LacI family transcriptional regulator n=1 Tax=Amycolatopsis endophytica TaxID=860233 RepID=A0A853BA31_9PSEU|nr:LacI family DNA-binding transcriptional regulator [Amycolatopsis endophytica]NYI91612.1 LacI family transcriptional regulator [Amycolatopsis endophytica]